MRKTIAAATLLLALTHTTYAADRLVPLNGPPEDVASLIERWREAAARTQVIDVDWETYAFIIPAAGSLAGANGTYFRSDVTLSNVRSVPQIISVAWVARGMNNGEEPVQSFTLAANTTFVERDFVATILGKSGLGSVVVIARDAAGGIDTNARIDGFSRIWTPQPNASGTVSQAFAPVGFQDSLATSYGYGLRHDHQYRTNVGMVNLYETPQTFTIAVIGTEASRTFTVNVQPYSMEQVGVPAGNYGDLFLRISSGANFNWWSAYGTSVDNITGDGWVSHVH